MKNLNIKSKAVAVILAGGITLSTLTGCGNYDMMDTKYTFNKAIIFGEDTATIVEIDEWKDYDGEQFQIKTIEGIYLVTSAFDTKLIDDRESDIKAEDIARSIMGEDVQINYLDESKTR